MDLAQLITSCLETAFADCEHQSHPQTIKRGRPKKGEVVARTKSDPMQPKPMIVYDDGSVGLHIDEKYIYCPVPDCKQPFTTIPGIKYHLDKYLHSVDGLLETFLDPETLEQARNILSSQDLEVVEVQSPTFRLTSNGKPATIKFGFKSANKAGSKFEVNAGVKSDVEDEVKTEGRGRKPKIGRTLVAKETERPRFNYLPAKLDHYEFTDEAYLF
ncbi:hypothetical protein EDD86DRAFT_81824 [Gorgonomyces haynaldii]|nr:hypothetical protein EDD86DRAFT_81824 [Gorgonomyces haynaldii]